MDVTGAIHDPRCVAEDTVSTSLKDVHFDTVKAALLNVPHAQVLPTTIPTTSYELSYGYTHKPSSVILTRYGFEC